MRVLFVCSSSYKTGKTGDATQGRETAAALLAMGHSVDRVYVEYHPISFTDDVGRALSDSDLNAKIDACDVVHHLPATRPLCAYWRKLHHKPTLGSSIFWGGWERVYIAIRTWPLGWLGFSQAVREVRNMIPYCMNYHGIDVFLPNSKAEGECVMRCFGHDERASFHVVPNGFILPSFNVRKLPRSEHVPQGDYIVVPGAFARRKNQLGLIRALKNQPYNIVFLGAAYHNDFYARCRAEATDRMFFTGFVSSRDEEYWRILGHARVACLASDCETPGIAIIESAYAGARPVITRFGGTEEYYGKHGEYFNPCFAASIRKAVARGWGRGRLSDVDADSFMRFSWRFCAEETVKAYKKAIVDYV